MKESSYTQQVKDWLKASILDGYYTSHKSAIVARSDPFGLLSDAKIDGKIYYYINGKLDKIVDAGQ